VKDPIWAYWQTTGLTPEKLYVENENAGDVGEIDQRTDARKAALSRAHEIRKFEIELYWKRAAHFWLLQAAVFTAIGLTWRFAILDLSPLIPVALAALGSVTAFAGYLSAKGSKFWQENWEHHIDMLEDEFEGRLHKTAYVGEDGIAWSVSGVNDRLAFCFFLFWLAIFASAVFAADASWFEGLPAFVFANGFQTILIIVATLTACGALYSRKTKFKGGKGVSFTDLVPTYEGTDWIDPSQLPEVKDLAKLKKPFLIRREPKI
jgi:hypothetical protein